jgi:hypothetical protein
MSRPRLEPHFSSSVRLVWPLLALVGLTHCASTPGRAAAAPAPSASPGSQERVSPDEERSIRQIRELLAAQVFDKFRHGERPAQRDAHAKGQGCVKAHFSVLPSVPARLRRGVFAHPRTYTAWIRFSNAVGSDDHFGLARGMAIKLTGVDGRKVLPDEADATTQDFLLVNYPIFNVQTAADYVDFFKKSQAGQLSVFFQRHPESGAITAAIAAQRVGNPLLQRYFSMTPYALDRRYVKSMPRARISAATPAGTGRH